MSLSDRLKARRDEILTAHIKAEKTRGSGWHPADNGSLERERKEELPLSERLIVLQDDTVVYVSGPDVPRVVNGLLDWLPGAEQRVTDKPGTNRVLEQAVKVARRLVERITGPTSHDTYIEFGTQDWNHINFALDELNLQVVSAGL